MLPHLTLKGLQFLPRVLMLLSDPAFPLQLWPVTVGTLESLGWGPSRILTLGYSPAGGGRGIQVCLCLKLVG